MSISSRFAVGIHILSFLEINKDGVCTSEYIAGSVNTNPVVIRKIMGMLKKAGLVKLRPGIAGAELAKDVSAITLLDVYKAVEVVHEKGLFSVHGNPNPQCTVGRNIQDTIAPLFERAQLALENSLAEVTLNDVVQHMMENERVQ